MSPADRKTDRHQPGRQYPVSLRLDKGDYDALETRRTTLGISRRQAIITAIREWAAGTTEHPVPLNTETTEGEPG